MLFTQTLATFATLALASATSSLSLRQSELSGQATYYGGNLAGGACSFSTYTLPASIYGTALSDSNWNDAGECGACVSVTGPSGNSITAMIVDECPGCGLNHLDLFPDAFAALADPTLGIIDVTWEYIDCPITSDLSVVNKDGVSAYYFALQVDNANKAVSTLEVSTDGGNTWQATTRATYNYFENQSGFGTTTVDVQITSVDGDVVTINDVTVASGATASGPNFPLSSTDDAAADATTASTSAADPPAASTADGVATSVADPTVASTAAGAVFAQAGTSSILSSTKYRTTSVIRTTTLETTTTSTSTIYVYAPSSSSCANATSTADISVLTISTCIPTVLYSVVTVSPTPVPTSSYKSNVTLSATPTTVKISTATSTAAPVFTGSAASLQSSSSTSLFLAACAGLAAFLFA